jgi:hypothetical protein
VGLRPASEQLGYQQSRPVNVGTGPAHSTLMLGDNLTTVQKYYVHVGFGMVLPSRDIAQESMMNSL